VLTGCYSLFLIVFAVLVELSQKFTPDEWLSETVSSYNIIVIHDRNHYFLFIIQLFYTYRYGAGIVFLAYFYLFKVHTSWFNVLLMAAYKRRLIKNNVRNA